MAFVTDFIELNVYFRADYVATLMRYAWPFGAKNNHQAYCIILIGVANMRVMSIENN